MTLATGSHIGPYEIIAPIGAGGMGEVFRARDTRLGRDVAIKILPTLFATDPDRLRRFEQEARAAAALNDPNILVLYDIGTSTGVPYVVSELLDGQTLRDALQGGALTPRKAVEYGVQMASGLAAAHEKGIVHRDLKPENVFVTKDGRIKILDFGLAKLVEGVSTDGSGATMAHTDPGMVVGTAGYMSPEQLRGEPVDARSDVFSLGAVLYEMFCGARAFKGKTAVDTMSAILKEDPDDFPPALHAAAPAIERIVRRCLEKNLHERFQSARDVMFAFEALSTASGVKPALSGAFPAPAVPAKRLAPLAIAASLGVLVAVAAAMFFAGARFGARTPEPPAITQLTFRNGTVRGARFSPDGQMVLYAAAWAAEPLKLYSMRPGSPESSALGVASADLRAISAKTGDMALALNPRVEGAMFTTGTLARAPISGGAPREIVEHVYAADFSPDGSQFAAVVKTPTGSRLEYPLGNVRATVPYILTDARVSPDGEQVAFIAHPGGGDDGQVQVIGKTGEPRTLSAGWLSVQGLAWAPGGRELWFTATRAGMLRALRAVTLDGRERLLYRAPARLQLEDVAPDGRVLISGTTLQAQTRFGSLREKTERDLSWFDYGTNVSLSADGRLMSLTESGEGSGAKYGVFVRPTNGDPAFRIADGSGSVLSPDGRQLAVSGDNDRIVRVLPTGPGTTRTFDLTKLELLVGAAWFPDNRRLALIASEPGKPPRTFVLDTVGGSFTPLTPEGTRGRLVSPDGQWLAVVTGDTRQLFNIQTKTIVPLKGAEIADRLAGWSADSQGVFASQPSDRGIRVFRIDVASGARTLVSTIEPSERSGFIEVSGLIVAADGDHYAYHTFRQLSQLYLLKLGER